MPIIYLDLPQLPAMRWTLQLVLPAQKNDVPGSYSIADEQADEIERLNRLIQVMLSQQQDRAVLA
jgi:hypothetical protein